ncbi:MAG TPA: hypothetical protein VGN54_10545, partial [Mycobacteriales bacterium]|nr:hypothetical protein [Mycobacteriales bacterium]
MPVRLARTLATIALFLTTATLGVALAGAAASSSGITYVQSAAFGTGSKVASTQVQLSKPILAGDLLVGWFSQYNAAGNVRVSDSVNGTWTRAPGSLMFGTSGDNALYYVQNSAASATGVKITVTAPAAAYLQGAVSNYRGTATSAALDQIAVAKGVSKAMSTGPTFGVVAGELVFSAMITGGSPGGVVAGSSAGIPYTARASTSSGSVFAEDITAGAGAAQVGSATLKNTTDWYAVVATFHAAPAAAVAPSVPVGLVSTSVTAAAVGLSWSASTDNVPVTGYTVFRGGVSVG